MTMMQPIAITGLGIISAIGVGKEETYRSLINGESGIGQIRYLDTSHKEFPVGEVQLSNAEMKKLLGCEDDILVPRSVLLGRIALGEALKEAGLGQSQIGEAFFISGNTVGGMDRRELFCSGEDTCDKLHAQIATYNCAKCTDMIAEPFGTFSFTSTISTACSSAANAIITGANIIRNGMADIVVAGGAECLSKFHLNGFNTLMILDHEHCRPFDKNRAGLNLGEGAAFLVIETLESAQRRGVKPLCLLRGYGNKCDAFHQTASSPDGEGAFLAMEEALECAGLRPEEIDYVNAHGTGTPNNDESESKALFRIFGENLPPVSSTKSFTGHTTSASGSIETVICALALRHQFLPVNLNWKEAMVDGIIPVTDSYTSREIVNIQSNAFGFGGNDSSLIFSKYTE